MCRYLLFVFGACDALGGWDDFAESSDDINYLKESLFESKYYGEYAHIIDLNTSKKILKFEKTRSSEWKECK